MIDTDPAGILPVPASLYWFFLFYILLVFPAVFEIILLVGAFLFLPIVAG